MSETLETGANGAAAAQGGSPTPPLYQRPALLDSNKHGALSLRENGGYKFAANANVMMVNAIEFIPAARNYPIVFAGQESPVPVVILGMRDGENLFVSDEGDWHRGSYVPAYARRYPFIFAESSDRSKLGLCIDEASDLVVESDVRPLFKDGKRTPLLERALEFCTAFQREIENTRRFMEAIVANDLLMDNRANVKMANGEALSVTGFRVIDEKKFNALPDETFLDWRKRGWIGLIYCHLISIGNWSELVDQQADRSSANTVLGAEDNA